MSVLGRFVTALGPEVVEPAALRAKRLASSSSSDEYAVTFNAAGHDVTINVPGDDAHDAAATFQAYLDHDEVTVADGDDEPSRWREVDARFDGQDVLFCFQSQWVAGFAVVKKSRDGLGG